MTEEPIISPVSIDLGAKSTGVYFAHYKAGSSVEDIEKDGKVYQLEKDSYTLLMANRTARRHQRRGYDRRQMVKRLFKLIWEKHFGLEWDKNVQQATSFLFNRRGFSFLTEEYDAEILSRFPKDAYKLLPDQLKEEIKPNETDEYDFASALTEWGNEGEEKTKSMFDAIDKEPERIRNRLFFIGKTKKLKEYCDKRQSANIIPTEKKKNLEYLSRWVWDEWQDSGVRGLDETFVATDQNNGSEIEWKNPASFNLVTYLNQHSSEVAGRILDSLPDTFLEEKELKDSIWNFKAENFKLEDKDFAPPEPPDENATRKEREDYERAVSAWKQLHLQHLAFALNKRLNEVQSGGRHRNKYFEEVKAVLNNENHTHAYLKEFYRKLKSGDCYPLTVENENLSNLIGHLSNLELKPLRKYFNDENHKTGDYWDEGHLNGIFGDWIMREWRVNLEKDKDKRKGEIGDYKKLREDWSARHGSVVDFWLKTDPFYTIPPYQDNNNRRPPRCQSLVLNPVYLDNRYPEWQSWLETLKEQQCVTEYLDDFVDQLKKLPSGKGKPYYSDETTSRTKKDKNGAERKKTNEEIRAGNSQRRDLKALDARILQFIFDRVKADDPLKLNEIYSHAKKIKQEQHKTDDPAKINVEQAKKELKEALRDSKLETLKRNPDYTKDDLFPQNSFLHLICKYYKLRQKARDGRLFIHPEYRYVKGRDYENTGRFDDGNCPLTYCNHKPRQKRYQMLGDLARILCTTEANLKNKANITEDILNDRKKPKRLFEKIENFFKEIKDGQNGLKGFMEDCAKAQKDYGNALNESIENNYKEFKQLQEIIKQEKESQDETASEKNCKEEAIKRLIGKTADKRKNSTTEDIKKDISRLIRLKEKSHGFAGLLAEQIYANLVEDERKAIIDKFDDPFSLAQIYNIVYKERNGYSRNCFVCSKDNSLRMTAVFNENQQVYDTKASRLPAIPTRLINGAVMRMARITAAAIVKDKWPNIEKELNADKKVHIPIIIEANRFEFEPSKEELVKSQRVKPRKGKALARRSDYSVKDDRIKEDGKGFCPYTGRGLSDTGEIDHIIPRQSKWGTLNDEANLIWTSHIGNHHKTNTHLSLGDLNNEYKSAQFPGKDDAGIERWIIDRIGNGEGENFKFGPYRSFINLSPEQQKAFRHALFLSASHPLRKKVIEAINNRNRALVNGTQRYFAEVLANNLHKEAAKNKCKQSLLSFDYFEASTDSGSSNVNVHSVRKHFEDKKDDNGNYIHPELQQHLKKENETQSSYSHLLDATASFMIALSEHYKDGSLKIDVPYISPYDYSDDNGELKDLYTAFKIDHVDFNSSNGSKKLKRRKPEKSFVVHKTLFDSNAGAWHFLQLIEIESAGKKHYLKGFLKLEKLKSCLRENDWEKAINHEYGLKDDTNNALKYKYGSLLKRAEKALPDLYRIGKDTCQFGYTNEKQQWPKVIIENQQLGKNSFTVRLHQIDKTKVAQFLQEHFNTRSNPNKWQDANCRCFRRLEKLWYFTKRKKLTKAPAGSNNQQPDFSYKDDDVKAGGFLNPSLLKAWADLNDEWNKYKSKNGESDHIGFLKGHFLKTRKLEKCADQSHSHERTRKEFSLPARSKGQGFMLIARKAWNKGTIYQCQAEKSGESGAGLYKKRINAEGKLYDSLTPYFRSRNIVLLKKLTDLKTCLSEEGNLIDEDKWYRLEVPSQTESRRVTSVENRYQSKGDSIWRITFEETPTMKDLIDLMYGGYHIDELRVGSSSDEKKKFKSAAEKYFNTIPGKFISTEQAKEKLNDEKNAINEKYQQNRQSKTEEDKKQLKFIQCWWQCLDSLDGKTLEYKRGVSLQIE